MVEKGSVIYKLKTSSNGKLNRLRRNMVGRAYRKMKSDSLSDIDAKRIGRIRNEGIVECSVGTLVRMNGDGHCLFHALAYFTEYDAMSMRGLLWRVSTDDERRCYDLRCLHVLDGSRNGWGNTDCVTVFSRVFNVNVCVHAYETDNLLFVTRMYSNEDVDCSAECLHLRWNVSDVNGHVDLLIEKDLKFSLCVSDVIEMMRINVRV